QTVWLLDHYGHLITTVNPPRPHIHTLTPTHTHPHTHTHTHTHTHPHTHANRRKDNKGMTWLSEKVGHFSPTLRGKGNYFSETDCTEWPWQRQRQLQRQWQRQSQRRAQRPETHEEHEADTQ